VGPLNLRHTETLSFPESIEVKNVIDVHSQDFDG
jgi:hypothetical protein